MSGRAVALRPKPVKPYKNLTIGGYILPHKNLTMADLDEVRIFLGPDIDFDPELP